MNWQPIETAPISDTKLRHGDRHQVFLWVVGFGLTTGYVFDDGEGGQIISANGFGGTFKVSHWMPLPEPPDHIPDTGKMV